MKYVYTGKDYIARALSVFWWKRVFFGSRFIGLQSRHKHAVLAHEAGHCHHHHTEIRVLLLLILPLSIWFLPWICRQQELQADRWAATHGFAQHLHDFLLCGLGGHGGLMHPSGADRALALQRFLSPDPRYGSPARSA